MYEALKPFKMRFPDGQLKKLDIGDTVEGFEALPFSYQQAALSTHQVRVRPADAVLAGHRLEPTVVEVREQKAQALAHAATRASVEAAEALMRCNQCDFETRSAPGLKAHRTRMHGDN